MTLVQVIERADFGISSLTAVGHLSRRVSLINRYHIALAR